MTRLIDADDIVLDYSGLAYIPPLDFRGTAEYFAKQIDAMPTIDAIPIEWLRKHMITHDEVVNGDYYADEAMELNLYVSDLIDKWQAERKDE